MGFRTFHGSFQMATGSTSEIVNIGTTLPQINRAFLIFTTAGTGAVDEVDESCVVGYLSSNSQLTFERYETGAGLYISWFVIQCTSEEFTVRGRGAITIAAASASNTASVAGVVDANQCIISYNGHKMNNGTDDYYNGCFCNIHLTAANTVTAKRTNTTVEAITRYEVVEWSNNYKIYTGEVTKDAQPKTDLISGGGASGDATIDMNRTFVLANWTSPTSGIQQVQVYYSITDTNELTFGQYSGSYNNVIRWYVIEFPANAPLHVQRWNYNWNPSTGAAAIRVNSDINPKVDPTRSFIVMSCSVSGTGNAFRRDFNLPRLLTPLSWSETQYNPATQTYDQHETRASVIELPSYEEILHLDPGPHLRSRASFLTRMRKNW